jgi:hypothetical protein
MKKTFLAVFLLPLALVAQPQGSDSAANIATSVWNPTPAAQPATAPAQTPAVTPTATQVPAVVVSPSIARDSNQTSNNNPPFALIAKEPALPLTLPGYELRVLDVQKPVLFYVNGTWVSAKVPIFCYYPTAPQINKQTAGLVDDAYTSLLSLSSKPSWDARELLDVLRKLKAADEALHPQPVAPQSAAAKSTTP